ncbi:MAG: [lysine-biosynthesis-protein LysW]---L-2-aminoadipate ligase [Gaiellaceae bacterium]|nr:[lysine-biosynthesis-protein LysW]---L-2-aminoadipate ligase [Gaiellaceae bacterium]MDX6468217.1 [lysine-biosynthesis-protein LysW]---L-2-aminoadipate ligase [Gaiellaceae bacterium]MDX6473803.1 [lysine-biosynthesis-protein LysW]---L-2-aminoadipate ligase [Gaiellaceae bacterium]
MRFVVVAHDRSETNEALAAAARGLGISASVLPPRDALRLLGPGDVALGRLDVREGLDGIESGAPELERLVSEGVRLLNPPSCLVAAHDKLLTARVLRLSGVPHPHSWLIAEGLPSAAPELPLVLKPRFGSWGRDVTLCRTQAELDAGLERLRYRGWFREHGVLAQELVPPLGWDLRVIVAGGRIVGAARRHAAPGEWRTNVSLGGRSEPADPPELACTLALAAAAAIGADLVGVDLLPTEGGFLVSELNGAVDFRTQYALGSGDVFTETVAELLRPARERRHLVAIA